MAISAPLTLNVAAHYGWGEWVKVALGGMIIYIVAMALTRGHAAVEEHARSEQQPAANRVTAG